MAPGTPFGDVLRPGDPVSVRYTKWDGSRHWTYQAAGLGEDAFGRWVAGRPGTILDQPDRTIVAPIHFVVLFPPEDRWTPCFNEDAAAVTSTAIYTDITTRPRWSRDADGWVVTMVDLDLDVIQRRDGVVRIDDEDEFAEHQVAMRYPAHVIAQARADCARVFVAMDAGHEPYASVGPAWLARSIA